MKYRITVVARGRETHKAAPSITVEFESDVSYLSYACNTAVEEIVEFVNSATAEDDSKVEDFSVVKAEVVSQ